MVDRRLKTFLFGLSIGVPPALAAVQAQPPSDSNSSMPDMSGFFDFDTPDEEPANNAIDIAPNEHPKPRHISIPDKIPVPTQASADELRELSDWVRWLTLRNLPPNYEDNKKWGKEKEIFNGVHMSMDGLRLDTKRKWKSVRHGTWSRYYVEFIDPANNLSIDIKRLEFSPHGKTFVTETQIIAPLKIFARVSRWQRNVQLFSISIDADAKVRLNVVCETQIKINPLVFPPDVQLIPKVTSADIDILEFNASEISKVGGTTADLIGRGIRKLLEKKVDEYNDKLVEKINQALAKQQDKLKFSGQDWMKSAFSQKAK